MYSHVIILTIFVSAFIAIVEMSNTFENVLAQQDGNSSMYPNMSSLNNTK